MKNRRRVKPYVLAVVCLLFLVNAITQIGLAAPKSQSANSHNSQSANSHKSQSANSHNSQSAHNSIGAHEAPDSIMTVKVGFFAFAGYHEMDQNGIKSGYGYEILQHIAGYAALNFEYIGYDKSWAEMQEMLANGEVDLLTSSQKTPERSAEFGFTTTNIGTSSAILSVNAKNEKFVSGDYANWNGMRVGMIKGNSRNEGLRKYAKEYDFTFVPVYFDSTEKMLAKLNEEDDNVGKGKNNTKSKSDKIIDAVLTSSLRKTENETVLAEFDASPFFVMTKKENRELLGRLDAAIAQMDIYEPGLRTKLMNKYYSSTNSGKIAFSMQERSYIKSMKGHKLVALLNPDRAPFSWMEDGQFRGIMKEMVDEIIARTGLEVELMETSNRTQYWEATKTGAADIRFDVVDSYNQAERDKCWLTPSYLTVPISRVFLKDTKQRKSAGAPTNNDINDNFEQTVRSFGENLVYYDSVNEAVEAVTSGQIDEVFLADDTATKVINDDETNRLVSEEAFGKDISYAIAINYDQNPLLYSIFTKAVVSLDKSFTDSIREKYNSYLDKPLTLKGVFYQYPIYVFGGSVILLVFLILLIVLLMTIKRKKLEHQHFETEKQQNELLKEALVTAEKAGAAKSSFLSHVSHELRTPLNAMIGFNELAKEMVSEADNVDKSSTQPAERYDTNTSRDTTLMSCLESSSIAAKQLLNVINDVLDMSSIESGKMKIANTAFDFRNQITSITNMFGAQCREKKLEYKTIMNVMVDDWLIGDSFRLNQILMNLLGNAVKFTSEGHVWLTISQLDNQDSKTVLRFTIEDTGCGMTEEMRERLFNPFEQEDSSTVRKFGGSGLGLSIVKSLVTMLDGSISVTSKQNEGSTFVVDLPFGRLKSVNNSTDLPDKVEALRILAVDDDKAELEYIRSVVTRMGARITCIESGIEAMKELERGEKEGDMYNVCLVDWRMPEMNGLETTKMIRKKYGEDLVVIVVSAYDFQELDEQATEVGANMFLSKPIFCSSLFDMLMTLTGGHIGLQNEVLDALEIGADSSNSNVEGMKSVTSFKNFSGKRVLLVEDNYLNQIVAKNYLEKYNLQVELAANGQIALDMFTASEPGYYDVIFMDLQMPIMDGFEATKRIRKSSHPQAETIHIIAQTADAFKEDIVKVLSAGMNAHVAKPIELESLTKALEKAFGGD